MTIITEGKVLTIPLVDIQMDETTQIRARTYPETVKEYRAAMIAYDPTDGPVVRGFPPIKVHKQKGSAGIAAVYIVVDGWHRVTAARSLGKTFIEAEQVFMEKPGNVDEMCWLALRANLTPGLRLTNAEKAASLRHYVKALQHRHRGPRGGRANGPFKTLREIGRDLGGMHHETVSRHLAKYAPNTLKAILEADQTTPEDEPAEQTKGAFNVDTMRGRKAAEAVAEVSRLIRLIDHAGTLKALRAEVERLTKMLDRKGA